MLSNKILLLIRKSAAPFYVTLSLLLFTPSALNAAAGQSYSREIVQYVAEDKVYLLENIRGKITVPSEKTVTEALLAEDGQQAVSLYQKQLSLYPDPAMDQISRSRIAAFTLVMEGPAPASKPLAAGIQDTTQQKRLSISKNEKLPAAKKNIPVLPPALASSISAPASVSKVPDTVLTSAPPSPSKASAPALAHAPAPASAPKAPVAEVSILHKHTTGSEKSFTLRFGSFKSRENAEALASKISQHTPAETIQQGELYRVQLKNHYPSIEEAKTAAQQLPFPGIVVPVI